jgi:outer membrane protein TolC
VQAINARRDFWIAATDLKAALIGGGSGDQPSTNAAPAAISLTAE